MSFLDEFLEINYEVIKKSTYAFKRNLGILFWGIVFVVLNMVLQNIAVGLPLFAHIAILMVNSALISEYLYVIENIITYGKYSRNDLKVGYKVYFKKIYIILLIFWFADYTIQLFLRDIMAMVPLLSIVVSLLKVAVLIVLSAVPEVVYQKYFGDFENIVYAYDFFKENWKEWGLPNLILFACSFLIYFLVVKLTLLIPVANPYLFAFLRFLIYGIAIQAILAYGMIYRGYLFKVLSISSKRKREYMRNMFKH